MAFIQVTEQNVRGILEGLKNHAVVFDSETTSKDPLKAKLVHVQFGSLIQEDVFWVGGPLLFQVMDSIIRHSTLTIAHNIIYDVKVIYWGLFEAPDPNHELLELWCNKLWDTKIGLKLTDENAPADLDTWVQANYQDDYKEVFWSRNKNYHDAPEDEQVRYGCADIVYTRLLASWIEKHPETNGTLLDHVQTFNQRLIKTSVRGLILDREYLMALGLELKESILKTEHELSEMAAHEIDLVRMDEWIKLAGTVKTAKAKANRPKPPFNWNSTASVKNLLYTKLKLPVQKSYKTKAVSVDDEALEKLAGLHPVADKLRDYRTYTKMFGAFVEGIFEKSRIIDGVYKVHPEFNPVATVTLRTGCSGPNFQQIPSDPTWGKLRGMLLPPPGYKIITVDYQSLEIYLAAAISKDPTLLEICRLGTSFHDATLEGMKAFPGVDRKMCKTMNFAILYGATEFRVSRVTKTSLPVAKQILEAFWAKYPGIKATIDECHKMVDLGLPLSTAYGNKRRPNGANVDAAKRQMYNFLIQSTGAGLTNRAFVEVDKELRRRGIGEALFVIHDEILLIAKEGHEADAGKLCSGLMEAEAAKLALPLALVAKAGEPMDRWSK